MTGDIWMAVFDKNADFRQISLDKTMLRLIKDMKLEFQGLFHAVYVIHRFEERKRERYLKGSYH